MLDFIFPTVRTIFWRQLQNAVFRLRLKKCPEYCINPVYEIVISFKISPYPLTFEDDSFINHPDIQLFAFKCADSSFSAIYTNNVNDRTVLGARIFLMRILASLTRSSVDGRMRVSASISKTVRNAERIRSV